MSSGHTQDLSQTTDFLHTTGSQMTTYFGGLSALSALTALTTPWWATPITALTAVFVLLTANGLGLRYASHHIPTTHTSTTSPHNTDTHSFLITFAVILAFAMSALLFGTWWAAWTHGGAVTIYVNHYGEALLELLLWSAVTAVLAVALQLHLTTN